MESPENILGPVPGRTLRRWFAALLVIPILIGAVVFFVPIPRFEQVEAVWTIHPEPLPVVYPAAGVLQVMPLDREGRVVAGQWLGLVGTTLERSAWEWVDHWLREGMRTEPPAADMGELAGAYAQLVDSWRLWRLESEKAGVADRLYALQQSIDASQRRVKSLDEALDHISGEIAIARENWERLQRLGTGNTVSEREVEAAESEWKRLLREKSLLEAEQGEGVMRNQELAAALIALQTQAGEEAKRARSQLDAAAGAFRGELESWEARAVVKAPVAGRLVFGNAWQSGQYVEKGPAPAAVVAEGAEAQWRLLGQAGSGFVEPGMKGFVRMKETGLVRWQVKVLEVADLPGPQGFQIWLEPEKIPDPAPRIGQPARVRLVRERTTLYKKWKSRFE